MRLVHVFLAAFVIGTTLSYGLWLRLAEREPAHLAFAIRGIRWIDRRLSNPAFALLLVTGVVLALSEGIPLTAGWLVAALALYFAAALLGYFVYGPVVRRQLAVVEAGGTGGPEYRRLRARARALGVVTSAMLIAILALMVLKPF